MNKAFTIILLFAAIASIVWFFNFNTKNDDEKLCECIAIGEIANELSASFFDRPYSVLGKDSLDQIIAYRDSICAPFLEMGANDLQNAAKKCDQLKIKP